MARAGEGRKGRNQCPGQGLHVGRLSKLLLLFKPSARLEEEEGVRGKERHRRAQCLQMDSPFHVSAPVTRLPFLKKNNYFVCIMYMCRHTIPCCACEGQMTILWNQLSPSIFIWGPEIDSGYQACVASTLQAELSSPTPSLPFFPIHPPPLDPFSTNALSAGKARVIPPGTSS